MLAPVLLLVHLGDVFETVEHCVDAVAQFIVKGEGEVRGRLHCVSLVMVVLCLIDGSGQHPRGIAVVGRKLCLGLNNDRGITIPTLYFIKYRCTTY